MEKKPRKRVSGPIRDSERTKQKLIDTIGKILVEGSYAKLSITSVSKTSNLNPKLIYLYFGSIENLINAFLKKKLVVYSPSDLMGKSMLGKPTKILSEDIAEFVKDNFDELIQDQEWQALFHWSLGIKNKTTRKITKEKDELLDALADIYKKSKDKKLTKEDAAAETALITAGARYLAILSKFEGHQFLGLDLSNPDTQTRLKETIDRLLLK